jgi:hypothetical protein
VSALRKDWSWKPPRGVAEAISRGDRKTHWKAVGERRLTAGDPFYTPEVRYAFVQAEGRGPRPWEAT